MDWLSQQPSCAHGFGFWKAISDGYDALNMHISFKVVKGGLVRFWADQWCGIPLKKAFSSSFSIVWLKEGTVAEHLIRGERGSA